MEPTIVIGGGIVGASIAFHLGRRGDRPVELFERAGALGTATTGKSSLGFRQYGTTEAQLRMKRYGKRLYNEFLSDAVADLRYEPIEVLHVATTDEGWDAIERTRASEHPMSSPSELVRGPDLRDVLVLPGLRVEAVTGALYRPNSGFFRSPESLVHEFADRARDDGVEFHLGTTVTDVLVRGGRVAGVTTECGHRPAADVVAAAGPWNNDVAAMAGVRLPVRQRRLHLLEFELGRRQSRLLPKIRHVETGVTFRGRPDGRVLAYHVEPAEDPYAAGGVFDPDEATSVPEPVKHAVLESAEALVPGVADAGIAYEDVAYTSRTPDGNPIVGWTELQGFSVAALHSRGIQYAPAVGDIVARQVLDDEPTELYPSVSIARFDGYTDSASG